MQVTFKTVVFTKNKNKMLILPETTQYNSYSDVLQRANLDVNTVYPTKEFV